jgi:predicted Rossmann fold flavoprotein
LPITNNQIPNNHLIMQKKIVIIGGGAAGFMGAITAAEKFSDYEIILLEKSKDVLAKVRISGGGRCNVTNVENHHKKLSKNYPRGGLFLLNLLDIFDTQATRTWFEARGVPLKVEKDGRIFPISDDSETIINCLLYNAKKAGVKVVTSAGVKNIIQISESENERFSLELLSNKAINAYSVLYATGGSPMIHGYNMLQTLGFQINSPVPSLFTLNLQNSNITELSGLSVPNAIVKVAGDKLQTDGPLLITHWGFSGPVILKLSAWGARYFNENDYKFKILINWNGDFGTKDVESQLDTIKKNNPKKVIVTNPLFNIPSRLWAWLCVQSGIEINLLWLDISNKKRNKLVENITNCPFEINGKSTFKEEFVTCGGVDLAQIDANTMESKTVKGLFFAGEILDIDALTGGFNFQAAWTTGYVAGLNLGKFE